MFVVYSDCVVERICYRVRPTSNTSAWSVSSSAPAITLLPEFSKQSQSSLGASTSTPIKSGNGNGSSNALPQEFVYDEVLTGSSNKEVYTRVARGHVTAAMEGYNAVVFAYGQTASGKTFTLVCYDFFCWFFFRCFFVLRPSLVLLLLF